MVQRPHAELLKSCFVAPAAFWRVKMWLQKQRDSRHKIWHENNVIRDIIWQQSPKTMHKSVRNTKTDQFWLCFLKYLQNPQFWSSKNVMDQKNGRIWHQMCLCGPIAPSALVTFMSSDQNVAPEVSLWLQAGLHVLQLLWGLSEARKDSRKSGSLPYKFFATLHKIWPDPPRAPKNLLKMVPITLVG